MVWSVTPLPHWLYLRSNKHQLWPHEEVPEGLLVRVKLDFEQFQDFEIWKVRLFASIFLYSPWCDQLHRCHIGCILDRISTNYDHTKKFPRDSWCEWSWTLNNFKSDFGLRDLKSPTFCFDFFPCGMTGKCFSWVHLSDHHFSSLLREWFLFTDPDSKRKVYRSMMYDTI